MMRTDVLRDMARTPSKMTFLLVRGRGRRTLQWHLSPRRMLVGFSCALWLSATAGFVGAQGADPHQLREQAYRMLSENSVTASLYRQTRRITFERMPATQPSLEAVIVTPAPVDLEGLEIATPEERRGVLRVHSLHLGEDIEVRPFDGEGNQDPEAFAAINRLWRCRFTDHEVPVNPRLVRLLTQLNDIYDRPIHLVSGHRTPDTVGTRPTSQHTKGTAADIRVPGVSAYELEALARQLGARGVGLYRHKEFVHVDFRKKRKYFWVYPEGGGSNEIATAKVSGRM